MDRTPLACGALIPDRTTRVAALVGLAPSEAEGLDWFEGMTASNVTDYSAARLGHNAVAERLEHAAARIRADPSQMIAQLYADLTEFDRQIVADIGIRRMLVTNFAEALRFSAAGWIDDVMAFTAPWGFDPSEIVVPTLLWHGADDRFTPARHSHWLGGRIPGAIAIVDPGRSHFDALDILPRVLAWLVSERLDMVAAMPAKAMLAETHIPTCCSSNTSLASYLDLIGYTVKLNYIIKSISMGLQVQTRLT